MRYLDRANISIAHGALTNSKRPESFVKGIYPTHISRSQSCYVFDEYNQKFIDYICGLGTNIFGYDNLEIREAVTKQLRTGAVYSLSSTLEVDAADIFKGMFTFMDRLRFLKTGSEACSAAIKIARAYTGRKLILSEGYHGWHDEFVSLTPPANGVIDSGFMKHLNEKNLENKDTIAGIILEPVIIDHSPKRIKYLRDLRSFCDTHGIVLIFDEIITGFRWPKYCVAKQYGINPDLICLGKGIGGGLPLSIVGGRAKIMEADYFVSSTFAGDLLSLAAGIKACELIKSSYAIDRTWLEGRKFIDKFNQLAPKIIKIEGYPTRGIFTGRDKEKSLFFQEMCKAGVLFGPSFFFNLDLAAETHNVLNVSEWVLRKIELNQVELTGARPLKPFAQKVRDV